MNKLLSYVFVITIMTGCSTTSSGVMPYGEGTYNITTSSENGLSSAKRQAITEANVFCSSKNKTMQPISSKSGSEQGVIKSESITYDIVFQCN